MIDFNAALQRVIALIGAKEKERRAVEERHRQELAAIDAELEVLQNDRRVLETAEQAGAVAQRYGVKPAPITPAKPTPEIERGLVILPALVKFLWESLKAGIEFENRTTLAKAAVKDREVRKLITSYSSLVRRVDELLEEAYRQAGKYLEVSGDDLNQFRSYIRKMQAQFPSRRTRRIPKELPPFYFMGTDDPLTNVPWGGKVAALAFAAMLPVKNGQPDYANRPTNIEDLVAHMTRINEETGSHVGRIDVRRCLSALDLALQTAVGGDSSKLGEQRTRCIVDCWKYESVRAFYEGYFLRILNGETVEPPRIDPVAVDERHLALPGER